MVSPTWPPSLSILVLYSQVEAVADGEPQDILAEQETAQVAHEIHDGLQGLGYRSACAGARGDIAAALAPYSPHDWLIFNLVESPDGHPELEATVPAVFEAQGFTYTGSPAATLAACLDKANTKKHLVAQGLPTPRYAVLSSPTERCAVPLPAIVKPVSEDASIGISWDSVVRDPAALAQRVTYILEHYNQPALVEEYITGREFNVAVWGNEPPEVLPLAEIVFQGIDDPLKRFCTYESKWVADSFAYQHTPGVCPADVPPALRERLVRTAVDSYRLLGLRDYARVDMRERHGLPYILEVNPNPSLASDAGYVRAARVAGFSQAQLAERIIGFALARFGRSHGL
jgi:D-alanine-D-alanine ligase